MGISQLNNAQHKVMEEMFAREAKSVLCMIPPGGGKTTMYEMISRMTITKELIVVVVQNHLHLLEKM